MRIVCFKPVSDTPIYLQFFWLIIIIPTPESIEDNGKGSIGSIFGGSNSDGRPINLKRVQKKELEELVSGCWETITGEVLPFRYSGPEQQRRPFGTSHSTLEDNQISSHTSSQNDSNIITNVFGNNPQNISNPATFGTSATSISSQSMSGQGVLSNLISQILAGEKPSDVCVEGMPVNAIRKLVSRQMSMATQLLVQILLQADERSDCFTKGYTSLMELSNMREKALKKAALVQMSVNNATVIQQYPPDRKHARLQAAARKKNNNYNNNNNNNNNNNIHEDALLRLERPFTRSEFTKVLSDRSVRSHSVFDVPALLQVSNLFNLIDKARKNIKLAVLTDSNAQSMSACLENELRNRNNENSNPRFRLLDECETQIASIMKDVNMRLWNCLIPKRAYPLTDGHLTDIDPTSLSGRSVFTPAEDDLLLRGIITLGEGEWTAIRTQFLPSKEAESLQFRLTQMTAISAAENNIFKT